MGLCRRARSRPGVDRGRSASRGKQQSQTRARHESGVFRSVRVHGARECTAQACRARHAVDHFCAPVFNLQPLRRGFSHHGHAAIRPHRRRVVSLRHGLPVVGCHRRRLHCAGGRIGRVWRHHAAVSEKRLGGEDSREQKRGNRSG